jgi:hypothetical protein
VWLAPQTSASSNKSREKCETSQQEVGAGQTSAESLSVNVAHIWKVEMGGMQSNIVAHVLADTASGDAYFWQRCRNISERVKLEEIGAAEVAGFCCSLNAERWRQHKNPRRRELSVSGGIIFCLKKKQKIFFFKKNFFWVRHSRHTKRCVYLQRPIAV